MDIVDLMERIRRRAYQIWESEGWPHGRHLIHWLRAESEIHKASKDLNEPGLLVQPARQTKRTRRKPVPLPKSRSKSSRKQPSKT